MYINRALLLAAGLVLIFLPALESWAIGTETIWYRPYQLWLMAIVAVRWNQRSRHTDEL
ncbi:MAG: hypothetical protein ACI9NT_000197 [Bacteroidia bacterium]|jgi:hypothetical protein